MVVEYTTLGGGGVFSALSCLAAPHTCACVPHWQGMAGQMPLGTSAWVFILAN